MSVVVVVRFVEVMPLPGHKWIIGPGWRLWISANEELRCVAKLAG